MFARVLSVGDTLNYQDRFSVRKAVRVQQPSSGDPILVSTTAELNGQQVTIWDGTCRKPLRHQAMRGDSEVHCTNTASSVPDRIELFDRSSGKGLGDRWVSLKHGYRWAISLFHSFTQNRCLSGAASSTSTCGVTLAIGGFGPTLPFSPASSSCWESTCRRFLE